MDAAQIKVFIDAMAASDLAEMEVVHDGWTLRLARRSAPSVPAPARAPSVRPAPCALVPAQTAELLAPLFGIVHLQREPGAAPFAEPGRAVRAGQTLCVIEAMKVFNEVPSDRDGIVDAVLVSSGAEVEAGQPLVRFR